MGLRQGELTLPGWARWQGRHPLQYHIVLGGWVLPWYPQDYEARASPCKGDLQSQDVEACRVAVMGPPVRGQGRWGPPALLDSPAPHHTLRWGSGLLLTSVPQVPCPSPLAHPFSTKQGLLLPQPRSIPSSRIFISSMSQCSHLTMSSTVPTSSGIEYSRDTPICLQGGQGSLLKGGAGSAQLSNPSIRLSSVPEDVDICSAAQPGDPCSPWAPRSPITSRDELQLHSSPWACPFFFSDPVDTR